MLKICYWLRYILSVRFQLGFSSKIEMPQLGLTQLRTLSAWLVSAREISARTHHYSIYYIRTFLVIKLTYEGHILSAVFVWIVLSYMKPNFNPHKYFKRLMLIYGQPTVFGCMTVQAEHLRSELLFLCLLYNRMTIQWKNNSAWNAFNHQHWRYPCTFVWRVIVWCVIYFY